MPGNVDKLLTEDKPIRRSFLFCCGRCVVPLSGLPCRCLVCNVALRQQCACRYHARVGADPIVCTICLHHPMGTSIVDPSPVELHPHGLKSSAPMASPELCLHASVHSLIDPVPLVCMRASSPLLLSRPHRPSKVREYLQHLDTIVETYARLLEHSRALPEFSKAFSNASQSAQPT